MSGSLVPKTQLSTLLVCVSEVGNNLTDTVKRKGKWSEETESVNYYTRDCCLTGVLCTSSSQLREPWSRVRPIGSRALLEKNFCFVIPITSREKCA